ncbi:MAG: pantetheine-phosphate adenylyltransferase [Clostridia bacterium]|nr:pantetheine-phosphate adenylyltransferase [Clostridia bacterium]
MSSCVIPGSFDPVTLGHQDLIRRAARLFDTVTVVIMINIRKQGVFPPAERAALMRAACGALPNVRVETWEGLLSEYMRVRKERTVIRGVRGGTEFDGECLSAQANRLLNPEMETLLMPAGEGKNWISSSAVKEIAAFGGDIRDYLPPECAEEIALRLSNR